MRVSSNQSPILLALLAFLITLSTLFPVHLAFAGTVTTDSADFSAAATIQEEDFESFSGVQGDGTAFTGFTATLNVGGEMNVFNPTGTGQSLCFTANTGDVTESEVALSTASTKLGFIAYYLTDNTTFCGDLVDGSGEECVDVPAIYSGSFAGITFSGPVSMIRINVTPLHFWLLES